MSMLVLVDMECPTCGATAGVEVDTRSGLGECEWCEAEIKLSGAELYEVVSE